MFLESAHEFDGKIRTAFIVGIKAGPVETAAAVAGGSEIRDIFGMIELCIQALKPQH
jgi:hypothetical protein